MTLRNRKSTLLIEKVHILKEAVHHIKKQHPFQIKAYVILPDHLHMIWELPEGDSSYSQRWKKIKARFSRGLMKSGVTLRKSKHNETLLWQRRFWEHTIKDIRDYENHVNYIHYNPIKHGLIHNLQDWPHSSFHHFVEHDILSKTWGSSYKEAKNFFDFGE